MNQELDPPMDAKAPHAMNAEHLGIAGRTARFFIRSPLSPLFYAAMLMMGLLGLIMTPRQEDPQISVPMIDIMVQYPGASAQQVANLAIQPLERIMSEIPGGQACLFRLAARQGLVTVEFDVGEDMGPSLVKVNDKLASNMDKIPPGVLPPLVRSKGIDDVPIVTLTLWSKDLDGDGAPMSTMPSCGMLAQDVLQALKQVKHRQCLHRRRTARAGHDGGLARAALRLSHQSRSGGPDHPERQREAVAGGVETGGARFSVITGAFLTGVEDIKPAGGRHLQRSCRSTCTTWPMCGSVPRMPRNW
jgi:hypothetical protein